MNAPFDPYYHWLGIPPTEQPPNHYRLLSVQLFEPNLDVISNAADRLMLHLRTFQSGAHSADSQRLLNEISSARICLLNPVTKQNYDVLLQQALQPVAPVGMAKPLPLATPLPAPVESMPVFGQPVVSESVQVSTDESAPTSGKRRKKKNPAVEIAKVVGGGICGLILATAILYFLGVDLLGFNGKKPTTNNPPVAQADPPKLTGKNTDSPSVPKTGGSGLPGTSSQSPTPPPISLLPKKQSEKMPPTEPASGGSNDTNGSATITSSRDSDSSDWQKDVEVSLSFDDDTFTTDWDKVKTKDASGRGHHGVVVGAKRVPGKVGSALLFDGKDDYVECVDSTQLNFTNALTLCAWVQPLSWVGRGDGQECVISQDDWSTDTHGFVLRFHKDGRPNIYVGNGAKGDWFWTHGDPVEFGVWHHLAVTFDGQQLKIFVDGKLLREIMMGDPISPSHFPLRIGRMAFEPTRGFHGLVDEVLIVRRALSPAAIQKIYENGENGLGVTGAKPRILATNEKPPDQPPAVVKTTPSVGTPRAKTPLPSTEQQDEVKKQIEDIYKISAAKTADEKLKLARDLFKAGKEINDNPGQRFVVFRRAMELSQEAGDVGLMMEAIDKLGAEFELDSLKIKESMLGKFAKNIRDDKTMKALIAVSKATIEQAIADDRYDVAVRVADDTYTACSSTFGKEYRKFVNDGRTTLKNKQKKWDEAQAAQETLKSSPDDPAANLVVGRWECFQKDQWNEGLARLAKGSDEKLRDLAQRDLTASAELEAQLTLADGWHDLAKGGNDNLAAAGRAYHWYLKAKDAATGLARARVENGLKDSEKLWNDLLNSDVGRQPLVKTIAPPDKSRPRNFADLANQNQNQGQNKNGSFGGNTPKFGEPLNVLAQISTSRDAISGSWDMKNGNLVTPKGVDDVEKGFKLKLPCDAVNNYTLTLDVARVTTLGNLIVWLPSDSGQKRIMLDGVKDGNPYSYVTGSNARAGQLLPKNTAMRIRIRVQGESIDASVSAVSGGKKVRLIGSKSGEPNAGGSPAVFAIQTGGSFQIGRIDLTAGDAN